MIYGRKWHEYAKQWDTMIIDPNRVNETRLAAQYAIANKEQYLEIGQATGVPWMMIYTIHRRESDAQDKQGNPLFTSYLGNGQPLSKVTTIVPKGRGPFKSFFDGAVDALKYDKLTQVLDWRLEKMLYYEESYNGTGYDMRGLPSPYLWGGTNIQRNGKFASDHVFRVTVRDKQLGVAPILYMIAKLDSTVQYVRET